MSLRPASFLSPFLITKIFDISVVSIGLYTHNSGYNLFIVIFESPLKAIVSIVVLIAISGGLFYSQKDNQDQLYIEDWYKQTAQIFSSASHFFDGMGSPSGDYKELDEQLQTLLPQDNIDLSYNEDLPTLTISQTQTSEKPELLPDLFHKKNNPSTKINGQVFTDDNDNIVGAEVNLSIPADIR